MADQKSILFLCTGNSCRSQMAEGFGHNLKNDHYRFYSAGTKKHGLNPYAIKVMKEVGIDISIQKSNTVEELENSQMDIVFTVCSDAHENCPLFPGGSIIHKGFDDPPRLTKEMKNEEEILSVYRKVRDQIGNFVENIDQHLPS